MTTKTPQIKQSVGAQYLDFATDILAGTYANAVEKSEVVKSIGTTENAETANIRASGKDYKHVVKQSSIDMSIEVVAFDVETLAQMRGDVVDVGGLMQAGSATERPFFAYGKVVKLSGGEARWEWFPKCQLVTNTDDIATSEESFSEQNDTLTIRAYPFDDAGNIKNYVQTDSTKFPANLTEAKFFTAVILDAADLAAANPVG